MSGEHPAAPPHDALAAGRLLVDAGWEEVMGRVLHGICHDLNGRVTSLEALAQLVGMDEPTEAALGGESARLSAVVRILMLVPGDLGAQRRGALLQDVLAEALLLFERAHREGYGAVVVAEEVQPVLVNHTRTVRGICVLADAMMRGVLSGPAFEVEGTDDEVRLNVTGPEGAETIDDSTLAALAGLFAMDGGELVRPTPRRVELTLPSLTVARARSG